MTAVCLQLVTILGGLLLLVLTFRKFVARKLTEELGICWSVFSVLFIVCGCFRKCFFWSKHMHIVNGIVIIGCVYLLLLIVFYISILLSGLLRKNQELAIIVSLLNQENESMIQQMKELDELTITYEVNDEKEDTICN